MFINFKTAVLLLLPFQHYTNNLGGTQPHIAKRSFSMQTLIVYCAIFEKINFNSLFRQFISVISTASPFSGLFEFSIYSLHNVFVYQLHLIVVLIL